MKVKELFEQYQLLLNKRRDNRRASNDLIEENKKIKKETNKAKEKLIETIAREMNNGKTLYQICMENFGVVDNRFHNLYLIFVNKIKEGD